MSRRLMTVSLVLATGSLLAGCFGGKDIDTSCDEPRFYEAAQDGRRVKAPEGLDDLDKFKEMPLPETAPAPPRAAGSPCVDRPPNVLRRQN